MFERLLEEDIWDEDGFVVARLYLRFDEANLDYSSLHSFNGNSVSAFYALCSRQVSPCEEVWNPVFEGKKDKKQRGDDDECRCPSEVGIRNSYSRQCENKDEGEDEVFERVWKSVFEFEFEL